MFNPLHSSTNQELFEKHLCNRSSHYDKYRRFPLQRKPSRATAKLTLFAVSKDEWDTKEDTGKSMKNALYVLWYAKRAKVTLNSEKINLVALAIIELRLSEGISQLLCQSVSQLLENSVKHIYIYISEFKLTGCCWPFSVQFRQTARQN